MTPEPTKTSETPEVDKLVDEILPLEIPLCGKGDEWFLRQFKTVEVARSLETRLTAANREIEKYRRYQLQMEGACRAGTATEKQILCHNLELQRNLTEDLQSELTTLKQQMAGMVEIYLCESQSLVLKPNTNYRFIVDDNCDKCKAIAAESEILNKGQIK